MGLHDFGRRLRAPGVWSSGWAVWGYMTLAEGLEPQGCGHWAGQLWGYMTLTEGLEPQGCGHRVGQYGVT